MFHYTKENNNKNNKNGTKKQILWVLYIYIYIYSWHFLFYIEDTFKNVSLTDFKMLLNIRLYMLACTYVLESIHTLYRI